MPVAVWAHAELGLGVILANIPTLRPLLEKVFSLRSTLMGSGKRAANSYTGDNYLELEEGMAGRNKSTQKTASRNETRIYGADLADSNSSLGGDGPTKQIVREEPSQTRLAFRFTIASPSTAKMPNLSKLEL